MILGAGKRRIFLVLGAIGFFVLISKFLSLPKSLSISGTLKGEDGASEDPSLGDPYVAIDVHPISKLMEEADKSWRQYEEGRSLTFKDTVNKYRRKYGRHPPPGFPEWYRYARERHVYNIDDFEQIMDDLRPFWAIDPKIIRNLAAHMWEIKVDGLAAIHIRDHKISEEHGDNWDWRAHTLVTLIEKFIDRLPDMDIAMNKYDQPRVVVPWDDMQAHLGIEIDKRQLHPEAVNSFTANMTGLYDISIEKPEADETPREAASFYNAAGKQYMDIAKTACPPKARANDGVSQVKAESLYKSRMGGIVKNYNTSSDLCTIGPEIQEQHGMLFAASSISATKRLVPVFGECKVNVNSDILFPANMYWKHDDRYDYDGTFDVPWKEKENVVMWRGVTSGGTQVEDNWRRLHRQRFVMLVNGTELSNKKQKERILTEQPEDNGEYENYRQFNPSEFANDYTDVGFVQAWGCFPNCSALYDNVWTYKPEVKLAEQFKYKWLVDVDGHSFSGRWRAFLESKSMGIKATIFREWHDSRLFAWRHFVPMDNRFDDLYSILTYFIGVEKPGEQVHVARHDAEGRRIALQGRDWARKVLRKDDIEIYMFRLLLEYGRIIDDNRDRIGYSGDGTESELAKYDVGRDGILRGVKSPVM